MSAGETDPMMKQLREQISDVDRSIIEAFNKRLKLVAQLKRYKDENGIAFVDPDREEWMVAYQSRANRGPLTDEGLRALYAELLALTKREVS
jgi:chorismate mutase / prephenate dehydratase